MGKLGDYVAISSALKREDLKLENYNVGSTQPLIRQDDLFKIEIIKLMTN